MDHCSKCGSDKVIPDASIRDGGGMVIAVNVYDHPDALVFKGAHTSILHTRICGDCGNVESYVQNPQELYSVYLASQQP